MYAANTRASLDYARETLKIYDDSFARQYREGDDQAGSSSREHYGAILRDLSTGFSRKITALDIGCGTGRYFHCLRNVQRLVGIDISPHMLAQARDPVHRDSLDIEEIDLLCGDIYALELPDQRFDLIYSIGVIGEFSPLNDALLSMLFRLLRPGGQLFLTAVDTCSRIQMTGNMRPSFARRVLRKGFPLLPSFARRSLNRTLSSCYVTETELLALLRASPFAEFAVSRYRHTSGWRGAHFDCLLAKSS